MANAETKDVADTPEQGMAAESFLSVTSECRWVAAVDGSQFLWIDPAVEKVFRCTAAELTSRPNSRLEIIHQDDRDDVIACWRRLRSTGRAEYDYRLAVSGGSPPWIRETAIFDSSDPQKPRVCGVSRDITEHRNVEAALRDSEAVYMSLVESLPLCVLRKDCAGRFQHANELACEMMGIVGPRRHRQNRLRLVPRRTGQEVLGRRSAGDGNRKTPPQRGTSSGCRRKHRNMWRCGKRPSTVAAAKSSASKSCSGTSPIRKTPNIKSSTRNSCCRFCSKPFPTRSISKTPTAASFGSVAAVRKSWVWTILVMRSANQTLTFFSREHAKDALADERRIIETGEMILAKIEKETYEDREDTWCSTTKVPLKDPKRRNRRYVRHLARRDGAIEGRTGVGSENAIC